MKMKEKHKVKVQVSGTQGRRAAVLGLLFSAALCCAGCGMSDDSGMSISMSPSDYWTEKSYDSAGGYAGEGFGVQNAPMAEITTGGSPEAAPAGSSLGGAAQYQGQKLIRKVNLSVETKEFDALMPALNTQIGQLGGYIENMETYNGSRYSDYRGSRYARMTIRIPKAQLDGFLETVSGICNVVRQNESADDVTLNYVDMESRRNTLRTEQERLLAFLEKAQSIEEIITIEDRLSNVRYQLESMEAQLRTIDNRVDYSTVDLDITEVKELTPVAELTVWEEISTGFGESLRDIGDGAVDFGVWFVVNLPYFVIWAAVIAAAVLVIKKLRKNKKSKREARRESQDAWRGTTGVQTAREAAQTVQGGAKPEGAPGEQDK